MKDERRKREGGREEELEEGGYRDIVGNEKESRRKGGREGELEKGGDGDRV